MLTSKVPRSSSTTATVQTLLKTLTLLGLWSWGQPQLKCTLCCFLQSNSTSLY
ncbi:hypothetical protein PF002_g19634 [Phytophthora fragariae]|uniref:Uncharacterized protein n=1 Tax=Phytophthora fragariae TaxID=53985 RepID=A0A6A3UZ33_9STRA|nr:hypothetical protein PF003_g12534 [Phytophthora fragariae]KAE8948752.1 hypothetical protein PF009_g1671 [Phytophthora fragariae]KAE9155859.1 hypothetical protein PF006_g185 [Phytophthora fragariae]KAE9207693.1 hypothetical protein PF002_g19634 [Phytophthora fragariae]KAE9329711.1 hypothetical protein PF001_g744 [Phytophthora fragariae]